MDILVGCDPELFVFGPDNKPVSAYGMSKGTKAKPEPVKNGAVQVDGMALEFNITPAHDAKEFDFLVDSVIQQMNDFIPKDHTLLALPVAEFGEEYLATRKRVELELGCDPDYNAYTGAANKRPDGKVNFRTGSGHIHIGWTEGMDIQDPDHREACIMLVRELDYTLGVTSMLWDNNAKRRELYGKAGAFRPKPYGVEYRTLSNAWVFNPKLRKMIFDIVKGTCDALEAGKSLYRRYGNHARDSINRNSKPRESTVEMFMAEMGLPYTKLIKGDKYVWE